MTASQLRSERPPLLFFAVAAVFCGVAFWLRWALLRGETRVVRPDEVYQTLEPAFFKVFGAGVSAWEWRLGLRSWLFPDFLALLMRIATLLHGGHLFYLPLIWAVLSVVSAAGVAMAMWVGWRWLGWAGALCCGALVGFWPDLVFMGGRTLFEIQSGNLLFMALCLAALPVSATPRTYCRGLYATGCLLGLVLVLRIQLLPAVMMIAAWSGRYDWKNWRVLLLGVLGPVLLLGINDWIDWGYPFFSVWKNIDFNLLRHGADKFGAMPAMAYLSGFTQEWSVYAWLPLLLLFWFGGGVARLPRLVGLVTVVTHSMVSHKEFSFIYGGMLAAMLSAGLGVARLWVMVSVYPLLPAVLSPLLIWMSLTLQARPGWPGWDYPGRGILPLWIAVGKSPDFCGLGVNGADVPFAGTGGYALLGRTDGKIYFLPKPGQLAVAQSAMNYVMSDGVAPVPDTFKKISCIGKVCLLRREGACDPKAGVAFETPHFPR